MHLLETVFYFIIAILILVSVHEFGHFYVARRCGVKIHRFSIGFGKVLWSYTDKQGTQFSLSALPFGGYVKMLDEREDDVADHERHLSFNQKTVWQRIAIVAAGPVANIILAVLLFWFLMLGGQRDFIPVVGSVIPGSIAAQAGFEAGQEIIEVDGIPTPTWQRLYQALLERLGESGAINFVVSYPDDSYRYELEGQLNRWLHDAEDPNPVEGLGLQLRLPDVPAVIGTVVPESAAERAGLREGDKVLSVDDISIVSWQQWTEMIRKNPNVPLNARIEREDQIIELALVPDSQVEQDGVVGRMGVAPPPYKIPDEYVRKIDYSLFGAFVAGVNKTWETSGFVLLSIKKLIVGEISTKNLSGPITIAKVAGSSADNGLRSFIGFLALLSVFLAVFNLLPIPVLDGGHLFYYVLEVIRGKPVSEKTQAQGYQVGLFLIISLTVLALYNDIMRL